MGLVTDVILPIALAFIMFSLGLGLTVDDFRRVVVRPKDFLVGAASQVILLPVVAFALVSLWPLSPELALGVMIIAAAPGGVTSNLLTSYARGDVALSISLTAIISLVSVITIPLVVVMSYGHLFGAQVDGDVSLAETAFSVFVIVTVPVLVGLLVRRLFSPLATNVEPWARRISTVLFVLVLAGAIIQQQDNIVPYFADAGLVTLVLNVVMMALAYGIAGFFASGRPQKVAISIECGLQNGTLAIAVAVLLFGASPVVIPAATYSLIMFATSLLFIAFLRRSTA